MDFDDNTEADEEMGLPSAGPSYEAPPGNSGRGGDAARSWNRRVSGGGGRYQECLKNHAVSLGGHAVDGCGEFLAAGHEGTLDALRCAACNCHRNFHRWDAGGSEGAAAVGFHHQFSPYYRTPAGYLHHHMAATAAHHRHRSPPLVLPSTSSGGGHGRDDQEDVSNPLGGGSGSGTKRFRTKFTSEQRDKMAEFGERVGWRIQKHDEAAVQQFCREACVKRHVLKVWMHNHRHTHGKKSTDSLRL